MAIGEIMGIYKDSKVIIPIKDDAELLARGGYGTPVETGLLLSSCETLYLLSDRRIKVVNSKSDKALNFKPLLEQYSKDDGEIWTKYLIYRDLRSRGYVVRAGIGWGITFRVYGRGTYGKKAAKYLIFTIYEGSPVPISKIREVVRLAQGMRKELIVAVMDRRGEIVYYSLFQLNLS